MKINVIQTPLPDLLIIRIDYFKDERGFFIESWNRRDYLAGGVDVDFVQEGHSRSQRNVLRGMHYQDQSAPMAKLVRCTVGRVYEVAIDIRTSSPTFGKWFGTTLSASNKNLLFVPVGFALGFLTLSKYAEVQYKQSGYYTPSSEGTILWSDSDVAIQWPLKGTPMLSHRDQNGISLKKYLQRPAF